MEADPRDLTRAALLFPGVGVRLSGAEAVFFDIHRDIMRPFLREASVYCDTDLIALLFEGGIDRLPDEKKQFFTYGFSAGVAAVALKRVNPVAAAGYSFGIYAALHAAGVCAFTDGLFLLDKANEIMQAASEGRGYAMGITVGLGREDIRQILAEETFESLLQTNCNHDSCHVFSGTETEIDRFLEAARREGAFKFERLDVRIPYHHPDLLAEVPERFRVHCDAIQWKKPRLRFISTFDGASLGTPEAIRDFTSRHPAHPIHWRKTLEALYRMEIGTVFECGPGISLTQNGRFVPFEMKYINIKKTNAWSEE
jgi:[acyl-carrier-protein] S-malonyltransferase